MTRQPTVKQKSRPRLADFMDEDTETTLETQPANASSAPPAVNTAQVAPENGSTRRGRPRHSRTTRMASFHLPLDLIEKLDDEAARTTGNKSLLLTRLLDGFFANKK